MSCIHAWGEAEYHCDSDQYIARCICCNASQTFANKPFVTRKLVDALKPEYWRPAGAEPLGDLDTRRKLFEPLYPRYDRGGTPNMLWLATSVALLASGLWVLL